MQNIKSWLNARAGDICSLLLGLMFVTFIVQITFRYVLNLPLAWTLELCSTLWLWTVFWGSTFVIRDEDHVRFDIVYRAQSEKGRRVLAFISCVAIVLGFAVSLPATVSYVEFYKIKKSVTLGIPLDIVFSVYLIFAVGMIYQYTVRCWRIVSGQSFEGQSFYSTPMSKEDVVAAGEGHGA
jgi:TRAP-type C4-dicarboxylate transport system permease small subunit